MGPDDIISSDSGGVFFPVAVDAAEWGRYLGVPWLAVTMLVGTVDVGFIPWYAMRCLN